MTSNTFRFYVTGDPHFSDGEDDRYHEIINMVNHIKCSADFKEHKFMFLLGDMTSTTHKKQLENYKKVFLGNFKADCILCDGLGNHDMYRNLLKHNYQNMYKFIQDQNTNRSNYIKKDKNMSIYVDPNNKLHYHITVDAIGTKLHFIHLNLLPIDANEKMVDWQYIYGNNALTFLSRRLGKIPNNEPVFIFSHIGFVTISDWGENKYWEDVDRENFLSSLKNHTIGGIFFGHVHATGIMKDFGPDNVPETYKKMLKEYGLYDQCVLAGGAKAQTYVDVTVRMEEKGCMTTVDKIEPIQKSKYCKDFKTTTMATIIARAPKK